MSVHSDIDKIFHIIKLNSDESFSENQNIFLSKGKRIITDIFNLMT